MDMFLTGHGKCPYAEGEIIQMFPSDEMFRVTSIDHEATGNATEMWAVAAVRWTSVQTYH